MESQRVRHDWETSTLIFILHLMWIKLICLCVCVCPWSHTWGKLQHHNWNKQDNYHSPPMEIGKQRISFRNMNWKQNITLLPSESIIHPQFSSVHLLSHVQLFATPWITARQASLSITNSRSSPKPMSIESVMPSNYLILHCLLLLLPSIFPSIRVFTNESALCIRWPKYWSFSFNISSSNEYSGLISFRIDSWISSLPKGLSRVFSNTTVQKHQFFSAQPSSQSNSHIHTWLLEKP